MPKTKLNLPKMSTYGLRINSVSCIGCNICVTACPINFKIQRGDKALDESNALINSWGEKSRISVSFSPTPTNLIGSFSSSTILMTLPPLAVPSSLERNIPVKPENFKNSRAWIKAFWPMLASNTSRISY